MRKWKGKQVYKAKGVKGAEKFSVVIGPRVGVIDGTIYLFFQQIFLRFP